MAVINWLHLSDLHFRKGDNYDSSVVLDALCRDLNSRLGNEFTPVDVVFVTGDLAYSGQPQEYELAAKFFDKLLSHLSRPKERLFVVPGNHDVDWSAIGAAEYWVDAVNATNVPDECRKRVSKILTDDDARRLVMRRFHRFEEFVRGYFPPGHLDFTGPTYSYSKVVTINGLDLAVAGLNSTWLSGPSGDRGRLVLGEMQVREALPLLSGRSLRVVLLHHPLEWLADWDRNYVELHLLRNADFILHGHRHWQAFRQDVRPEAQPFVFASGAGYEGRNLRNACNAVRLDTGSWDASAVSLRYTDDNGGFWYREALGFPDQGQEVYAFRFRGPRVAHVPSPEEDVISLARLVDRPLDYLREARLPRRLHAVLPDNIVEVARQAPAETVAFLEWMATRDSGSLIRLLSEADGGLASSLAWDPGALANYRELRQVLTPAEEKPAASEQGAGVFFLGPMRGGLMTRLSLQIPKKDASRPRLAGEVRFSLYLANAAPYPLRRPRVSVTISSDFLSYPYQGEPLRVEPSEYWTTTRSNTRTYVCTYSAPPEDSSVVESGKGMSLGTVTLLIPWGEADGQPIDIPIPFRIESESFGLVEGQLGVRIVAALDFDEAKANGQVFQVRAVDENGLDTGLQVDRGQILRFASRGVISFDAGNHFATPDGLPCTQNGERIRLLGSELDGYFTQGDLLMQGQRLGAIVGWIGKPEEHTVFLVGSSSTVVVTTEGTLRLAVNDVRGQFNDNIGYFEVAVREE